MAEQTGRAHLTLVSSQTRARDEYFEQCAHRKLRALDNYYTAERRSGVDAVTAYDRMCAFGDDYDRLTARIAEEMAQ